MPDKITHKILIAVDGSPSSYHTVEYAANILPIIPNVKLALLYVLPAIPPYLEEGWKSDSTMRAKLRKLKKANQDEGERILADVQAHLSGMNVDPKSIEAKIIPRPNGLAKDILNEAWDGRYDALLIGRRGLSKTQEVLMGSLTNQLVQHASNVSLGIIDGQVTKPRIMIAVDGSEASLKAVRYVGFMLKDNPEAVVHFLHVTPKLQNFCSIDFEDESEISEEEILRGDQSCIDDFTPRAMKVVRDAGFTDDRISSETREITLASVAGTIVSAAKEGDFGTIVVGRSGMGRAPFLGSVSYKVVRKAQDMAVWVVT